MDEKQFNTHLYVLFKIYLHLYTIDYKLKMRAFDLKLTRAWHKSLLIDSALLNRDSIARYMCIDYFQTCNLFIYNVYLGLMISNSFLEYNLRDMINSSSISNKLVQSTEILTFDFGPILFHTRMSLIRLM